MNEVYHVMWRFFAPLMHGNLVRGPDVSRLLYALLPSLAEKETCAFSIRSLSKSPVSSHPPPIKVGSSYE